MPRRGACWATDGVRAVLSLLGLVAMEMAFGLGMPQVILEGGGEGVAGGARARGVVALRLTWDKHTHTVAIIEC